MKQAVRIFSIALSGAAAIASADCPKLAGNYAATGVNNHPDDRLTVTQDGCKAVTLSITYKHAGGRIQEFSPNDQVCARSPSDESACWSGDQLQYHKEGPGFTKNGQIFITDKGILKQVIQWRSTFDGASHVSSIEWKRL